MISDQVFELFEKKNPRAAALLGCCPSDGVLVQKTVLAEDTLAVTTKKGMYFLHNEMGAQEEAEQWFSGLSLDNIDWFILFGVGLGWHIKPILAWLKGNKERHLVILEDDLSVVAHFLRSPGALEILENPQVSFSFYEEGDEGDSVIKKLAWATHQKRYLFATLPAYQQNRPKRTRTLKERIVLKLADVHMVLDEYSSYGIACFHNLWSSYFKRWDMALAQTGFFNKFKGKSALILGAGPSLDEQFEAVKGVYNKLLILGGGSSLPACASHSFEPHIAAGIDPNPPQYMRLRQSETIASPFFFSGRMLDEALELVEGPLVYCRVEEGFGLSKWLEERVGIRGPRLDAGHGVVNLLIELAYHLGCRRIALLGVDLSYTEKKLYPKSVQGALGQEESLHVQDQSLLLEAEGEEGRVWTEPKWLVEASWITNFKKKHPQLQIVNLARSGLKIEGVPYSSLEAFVKDIQEDDLAGKVAYCALTAKKAVKEKKKIMQIASEFKTSLNVLQGLLVTLASFSLSSAGREELLEDTVEVQELLQKIEAEVGYEAFLRDFEYMQQMMTHAMEYFLVPAGAIGEERITFRNSRFLQMVHFLQKCTEVQVRMLEHFEARLYE